MHTILEPLRSFGGVTIVLDRTLADCVVEIIGTKNVAANWICAVKKNSRKFSSSYIYKRQAHDSRRNKRCFLSVHKLDLFSISA